MANQSVNSEQYKNLSMHKLAQPPLHINVTSVLSRILPLSCSVARDKNFTFLHPGHFGMMKTIKKYWLCRLHTAFLHWPLSSAATKKV